MSYTQLSNCIYIFHTTAVKATGSMIKVISITQRFNTVFYTHSCLDIEVIYHTEDHCAALAGCGRDATGAGAEGGADCASPRTTDRVVQLCGQEATVSRTSAAAAAGGWEPSHERRAWCTIVDVTASRCFWQHARTVGLLRTDYVKYWL